MLVCAQNNPDTEQASVTEAGSPERKTRREITATEPWKVQTKQVGFRANTDYRSACSCTLGVAVQDGRGRVLCAVKFKRSGGNSTAVRVCYTMVHD